jgi:hypothetical protein
MSKKTSVFLLLTLFIFNSVGFHLLFLLQRSEAREASRNHLVKKETVTLRIPLAAVSAKNSGFVRLDKKEVIYNGHRYDIHNEHVAGDYLVINGHRDDKEDNAYSVYEKNSTQSDSTPSKTKDSIKLPLYDIPSHTEPLASDSNADKSHYIVMPFAPVLSPFFAINVPPPELS